MENDARYYVKSRGKGVGPYSLERLRRAFAKGEISAGSLVRQSNSDPWIPWSQVANGIEDFQLGQNSEDEPLSNDKKNDPASRILPVPPPPEKVRRDKRRLERGALFSAPATVIKPTTAERVDWSPPPPTGPSPVLMALLVVVALLLVLVGALTGWIARDLTLPRQRDVAQQPSSTNQSAPISNPIITPLLNEDDSDSNRDSTLTPTEPARAQRGSVEGELSDDLEADPVAVTSSGFNPPNDPIGPLVSEDSHEPVGGDVGETMPEPVAEAEPDPMPEAEPEREPAAPVDPAELANREVLYQSVQFQRRPRFELLGTPLIQELHYLLNSELRVSKPDRDGYREVAQTVQQARLLNADPVSGPSLAAALKKLEGWQFEYRINRFGEVVDWRAGPVTDAETDEATVDGSEGVVVTTVLDEDGWKELSALTFFRPPVGQQGEEPFERQMTHDFGPLGKWWGMTKFVPGGVVNRQKQYSFRHEMTYEPPEAGLESGLPFEIVEAKLEPRLAEGTIEYDTARERISRVVEQFEVLGNLTVEMLSTTAPVEFVEPQTIIILLEDKKRWE